MLRARSGSTKAVRCRQGNTQYVVDLIDAAWAKFLATQDFLVDVSLDGPQELHDVHRYDKQGCSGFSATLRFAIAE